MSSPLIKRRLHDAPRRTNDGETARDHVSGIECLPHNSPLAAAILGLAIDVPTRVKLPAGAAIVTIRSIRYPNRAELDSLLTAITLPEIEDE
jgi:transcription elongation factor GreA